MASKRCPLCRKLSEGHAQRCGCGYTFGQNLEDTLALLDRQLHKGMGMAGGGALIVLFGIALFAIMIATPTKGGFLYLGIGGWIGGFTLLARGVGMSVRARTSKRELEARSKLPEARVIEK
jgi:Flp pilus assembly protein TadB